MKRREFITLVGGAAAATTVWPFGTRAQQRLDRVRRIAVLMGVANDSQGQERVRAFRQGLQAAGWADGPNVQIDYHWVGGDADRARAYAAEVVSLQPDVILANGTSVVAALQRETRTVPIVFVLGLDQGRKRLCRGPCAAGRQRYRVHDIRARDGRQMA